MARRRWVAAAILGMLAADVGRAEAAGAWLSSAALTPTEQRVAIAVGPSRTTLWTSLRFDATGGAMAIIVPAPPGASLDLSSDAWFEALEVATAPRLFPPPGGDPFCPGKSGSPNLFQLDGPISHTASLTPQEITVLADASALAGWTAQAGFAVSTSLQTALAKLTGARFVAVRFNAPTGAGVTPTLRVAMPSAPPLLPLALTRAGGEDLRVTAWIIGPGRADLIGATEVLVAPSALAWKAKEGDTTYEDQRASALASDPTRFLVEAAGHPALGQTLSIADGTASVDSVVTTFFERAAAYGDGDFNASPCIAFADNALVSTAPVAASCPHAALGVLPPAAPCTEAPGAGEIDPKKLRCGPGADDLAVALSGLTPASTWVTRQSLVLPAGAPGTDWFLGFTSGPAQSPVLYATSVDASGCPDGGAPQGGTTSSNASSSGFFTTSSGSGIISTGVGNPAGGSGAGVGGSSGSGDGSGSVAPAVADAACTCAGAGTQAAADACSSDSSSSSGCNSGTSGSDACSGSSSDSSACSGSSDSSACSGSSSSSACSGSSDSSACSGSSSGSACSGADFGKCSMTGTHRPRGPRFSILALAAFALLAPLRRRGRKRRGGPRARA